MRGERACAECALIVFCLLGLAPAAFGGVGVPTGARVQISYETPVVLGQLLVVEINASPACINPVVLFHTREFPSQAVGATRHALVPIALGGKLGQRWLRVRCGSLEAVFPVEVEEGNYPVSELSVASRFVSKPPARVRRESRAIKKALGVVTPFRGWGRAFLRPAQGEFTSPFGVRREFNQTLKSRHRGLDIDGAIGDPVVAANDGRVVLAAKDFFYVGNAVILDHGHKLFTLYFHLDSLAVHEGQTIRRGDSLGTIGQTGRVTGPHLHFATKLAGVYFNPENLLAWDPNPATHLAGHRRWHNPAYWGGEWRRGEETASAR